MFEVYQTQLITGFLGGFRKELLVEGVPSQKVELLVEEMRAHLFEAMELENVASPAQVRGVLQVFGKERKLARSLAAEYRHGPTKGRFLWPAVFVLALAAAYALIPNHMRVFGKGIDELIFDFGLLGLPCLGFLARRPLFGQFAAIAVALVVGNAFWSTFLGYPVPHGPDNSQGYWTVRHGSETTELATYERSIAEEQEIARRVEVGQRVFADLKPRSIPGFLRYGSGYLGPWGVREAMAREVTSRPSRYHLKPTLSEAVDAWNGHTWVGGLTQADAEIHETRRNIAGLQQSIDFLLWISKQSYPIQWAYNAQMMARVIVVTCVEATLLTNAGWLLWLSVPIFGRQIRRIRYGRGGLAA